MRHLKFLGLMLSAALAGGCGDDDSGAGFTPTDDAQIRALHAAPSAPPLEILLGDAQLASDLAYGATTEYRTVPAGTRELVVRGSFGDDTEVLASISAPLTAGAAYTTVVTGADQGIVAFLFTDDPSAPPAGQGKIRLIQAVPTAPPLDVYFTAPGADLTAATPAFISVTPGTASGYTTLPAGTHQVRVTPEGEKDVLIDAGNVDLADGAVLTAVTIESAGEEIPFSAVILTDRPS